MTLNPNVIYPTTRSYVLKLHCAAVPEPGKLAGRLENMASGRHFDFHSGEQLLDCLAQDLALSETQPVIPG